MWKCEIYFEIPPLWRQGNEEETEDFMMNRPQFH